MTYLLDTDVLVDFFKHKEPSRGLISHLATSHMLAISALTIAELRSGWTEEEADYLMSRLTTLCEVIPVTKEIANQAGAFRSAYARKGVSLGTVDTVIAATVYLNNFVLITNNTKDFPMPEITLYSHAREKAA